MYSYDINILLYYRLHNSLYISLHELFYCDFKYFFKILFLLPICLLYLLFPSFMRVRERERDYSGEWTCDSCSGQQGSVSGSLQHCSSSAGTVNLSSKQFLCWIHRIVKGEYCAKLTRFLYLFRRTPTSNTSAAPPAHFLTVKTWFNLQFH